MQSNTPSEESVYERIARRDQERKLIIEKRKEEKEKAVETEQAEALKNNFYSACKDVRDSLTSAETVSVEALPDIFSKANKEIALLKNCLFQSKMFLNNYNLRKAQEHLQLLESDKEQLEKKLLPRKKFGFKNRKLLVSDTTDGFKELKITETITNGKEKQNASNIYKKYLDNTCSLKDRTDEQIILDAENVNKNDVLLSDLKKCTVWIYGAPITVHMVNLQDCTVLIGPVTSSTFIEKCSDCQLVVACQQLRLHSSTNCTIYLHVTSRAIIEDSIKIRFAPYNWTYQDQMSHFALAGLDPKINNWDSVDDFNWPCAEKRSPNWSILEPELRVQSWVKKS